MSADPITRTVTRNLCTGCGACAGAFPQMIRMVDDPVNGRRPVVEGQPEGAARPPARPSPSAPAPPVTGAALSRTDEIDEDWGPVLAAWEGWASDDEIWGGGGGASQGGSSGGAGAALALHALIERSRRRCGPYRGTGR